MQSRTRDGISAGALAGVVSALPSTLHAIATGRDPLEATRAAGTILFGEGETRSRLALAGAVTHLALSMAWGCGLAALLPRRHVPAWGTAAGLAIAALDLGLLARRVPAVRRLPSAPQVLDHAVFGAVAGAVISARRGRAARTAARPSRRHGRAPTPSRAGR